MAVGPKIKRNEQKHVYSEINKRWNKKEYLEDKGQSLEHEKHRTPKSFQAYQANNAKK